MSKLHLFDIEGTTTDIKFVHDVLFPYAKKSIKDFILNNQTNSLVRQALEDVQQTVWKEDQKKISLYDTIDTLINYIDTDRKHGALKSIQGLIWDVGYSKGDFKGHVYDDVKPYFESILKAQEKIGIYSSGSVHAQKLIFGYSIVGDLNPMISYYFDTKIGGKREVESYSKIAQAVNLPPRDIHFYSDIAEELKAAQDAGMEVTQLLRPGTLPSSFKGISSFLRT